MVNILAHHGLWTEQSEQGSLAAFRGAFESNYGATLTIRDHADGLVISHDTECNSQELPGLDDFISVYRSWGRPSLPLGLNVHSCDLTRLMSEYLDKPYFKNAFLFDSSGQEPDAYAELGCSFLVRQGANGDRSALYEDAYGIFLDESTSQWISQKTIDDSLRDGKNICILSPDLRGIEHMARWEQYKGFFAPEDQLQPKIMLCTNHPKEAQHFFNL
jgi:hypothetical protein